MNVDNENLMTGDRFIIDGGDGDQSYFSEPINLTLIEADWFSGLVGDFSGDTLLFKIEGGQHHGELVALTPKTLGSLRKKLIQEKWASVVVHIILNPTVSFEGKYEDFSAIGMAVVDRVSKLSKS